MARSNAGVLQSIPCRLDRAGNLPDDSRDRPQSEEASIPVQQILGNCAPVSISSTLFTPMTVFAATFFG